jgi:hypothetical protein
MQHPTPEVYGVFKSLQDVLRGVKGEIWGIEIFDEKIKGLPEERQSSGR